MSNEIGKRIQMLRNEKGLSQEALGRLLKIGRSAISRIESGTNNLTETNIDLLCERLNVNRSWLLNGEGEMLEAAPSTELDALAKKYRLRHKDYVLIEKLVSLDEKRRDGIFHFMMDVVNGSTAFGANPDEYVFPENNVKAAEASYEDSLGYAPSAESSASNTTGGTASEKESVAND